MENVEPADWGFLSVINGDFWAWFITNFESNKGEIFINGEFWASLMSNFEPDYWWILSLINGEFEPD